MEAIISQKRKRSSSSSQNPLVGTFTRSKSQICHHYLRSGRVRSDPFRRCQFDANLCSHSSRLSPNKKSRQRSVTGETLDSIEMDDLSRILIKDLRTRRVFSLCSEANESGLCVGSEEEKVSAKKKEAIQDGLFSDLENINSGSLIDREDMDAKCLDTRKVGEKEVDVKFSCQESNSTDLQVAEGNGGRCLDGEISGEDCVQATPPDAEILQKLPTASDNRGPKSVLRSRSRVKVFKVPHSFSYRRLLPYLMAMEQDNSPTATKGNCSKLESRSITVEEVKLDGKSMEDIAGVSGLQDKQNFADQTIQQIVDSDILSLARKDSSHIVSSSTSLDGELCSKHFFENLNENIESKPQDGEESVEKHNLCEAEEVKQGVVQTDSVDIDVFDLKCDDETINPNPADKVDDSNGESNRMTTRDVEIFGSPADREIESVLQSADQVLEGPVNGIFTHNNSCFTDDRTKSSSKRKLGLSPLWQIKLYKTEGSLNYRRLLPFLMDIAKDNSGDSRQCHSPTFHKSVKENLASPLSMPVHESPAQILNNKKIHLEKNIDSSTIKMAKQAINHESGSKQSSLAASDHKKAPSSVAMEKEQVLKDINHASDDKLHNPAAGSSPDTMIMSSSAVSPCSCSVNTVGPLLHNEDDCKKSTMVVANAASPVEADISSLSKNSYKLEAFGPLEIAVNGSRKGILKRSPRGCRGPCTCLNCASFRLNAERAFEFSKNQMQDAEEVALELIEELSHLRNMLGTAASACIDNVVIPINQVKEACLRVSEAQEVAKNRLMDMNYDLNIHCRTTDGQRPRVKFANNANPSERPQQ